MTEKIKKFSTGFTQVSNVVLTDPDLSLKAKAIYAYLFSKPEGWVFHIDIMKSEIKESKKIIRCAIKELISKGYIKRNQINEKGRFGGVEYEFVEIDRVTKNRHTVKPHTENYHTNNTNSISNKDINNTPPTPNRGEWEGFVCLLRYFNQFKIGDDKNSENIHKQWGRFSRWVEKNDLSINDVLGVMKRYMEYRDDDYAPIIDSLGEMMLKWSRIVRFCDNW